MPEISVEIWCGTCGAPLCNQTTVKKGHHLYVETCGKCLQNAEDLAKKRGYDEGFDVGFSAGQEEAQ